MLLRILIFPDVMLFPKMRASQSFRNVGNHLPYDKTYIPELLNLQILVAFASGKTTDETKRAHSGNWKMELGQTFRTTSVMLKKSGESQ